MTYIFAVSQRLIPSPDKSYVRFPTETLSHHSNPHIVLSVELILSDAGRIVKQVKIAGKDRLGFSGDAE
jgi:hypothetical protein